MQFFQEQNLCSSFIFRRPPAGSPDAGSSQKYHVPCTPSGAHGTFFRYRSCVK